MPRTPAEYEGENSVTCRLCRREFSQITWGHLKARHGLGGHAAVQEYKARFGISRARCRRVELDRLRSYVSFLESIGRRWTKGRVLQVIQRRRDSGKPLSVAAVKRSADCPAAEAGIRLYGTWTAALRAAKLDPSKILLVRRWSKAALVRDMRRRARGGVLRPALVGHRRLASLRAAARNLFGSWEKALASAGLRPLVRPRVVWTRESILAFLRERVRKGMSLGYKDVSRSEPMIATYCKRLFGKSWGAVLKEKGYRLDSGIRWSDEVYLRELRRWHRTGRTAIPGITYEALYLHARTRFGSWWNALDAAGLRPHRRKLVRWNRGEVVRQISRRHRDGLSLSWRVVFKDDSRLYNAARIHLGKPWIWALRELGYDGS